MPTITFKCGHFVQYETRLALKNFCRSRREVPFHFLQDGSATCESDCDACTDLRNARSKGQRQVAETGRKRLKPHLPDTSAMPINIKPEGVEIVRIRSSPEPSDVEVEEMIAILRKKEPKKYYLPFELDDLDGVSQDLGLGFRDEESAHDFWFRRFKLIPMSPKQVARHRSKHCDPDKSGS